MKSGKSKQPGGNPTENQHASGPLMELLRISDIKIMEQFSTSITHELNQPLTALLNYLQASLRILENNSLGNTEDVPGMLRKAINEAKRADNVITRLRDLVEADRDYKTREDLNAILQLACEMVRTSSGNKGIETTCELQPDLPPVNADRLELLLVLINLLQNSMRALDRSILRKILIRSCTFDEDHLEVTVQDTGPGVNPEILRRDFFSIPEGKQVSMGLGLTLCKSIIDAHGGRLWVESGPEGGASFHFTLPIISGDR